MKNLLCIHGAWSTPHSFNYIIQQAKPQNVKYCTYDCQQHSISEILRRGIDCFGAFDNSADTVIVGHSFGGVIALALSNQPSVVHTITLSAPIAGTHAPNWFFQQLLITKSPILRDIAPTSRFINKLKQQKYNNRVDIYVSTKGFHPLINDVNDGVITVRSQTDWTPKNANIYLVQANHFEILLHPHIAGDIRNALINEQDK